MTRTYGSINAFILALFAAVSIGLVAACENTARGLKKDASDVEAQTRDERSKAEAAAKGVARDTAQAARTVGGIAAEAGEELAERAGAMKETVDVKSALMADPGVDATRLNVDVDYRTHTVSLNGYVPSPAERDRAEAIAKDKARGYKVVNNLSVRPRG